MYQSDTIPAPMGLTLAALSDSTSLLLWTVSGPDFIGGVVLHIMLGRAEVVYNRFHPDDSVCLAPKLQILNGNPVLIEERAGLYPVADCIDTNAECVWRLPST